MGEMVLVINTMREGYGTDQVSHTMTVAELVSFLQDYPDDTKVYLAFDRHYTFGGINEEDFEEYYEESEEEE